MIKRLCDKCRKEIYEFPIQAACFPIVKVFVVPDAASCSYGKHTFDLCPTCQRKVYEFICNQNEAEKG